MAWVQNAIEMHNTCHRWLHGVKMSNSGMYTSQMSFNFLVCFILFIFDVTNLSCIGLCSFPICLQHLHCLGVALCTEPVQRICLGQNFENLFNYPFTTRMIPYISIYIHYVHKLDAQRKLMHLCGWLRARPSRPMGRWPAPALRS